MWFSDIRCLSLLFQNRYPPPRLRDGVARAVALLALFSIVVYHRRFTVIDSCRLLPSVCYCPCFTVGMLKRTKRDPQKSPARLPAIGTFPLFATFCTFGRSRFRCSSSSFFRTLKIQPKKPKVTPILVLEHFGHHFGINFQRFVRCCLNLRQRPKCLYPGTHFFRTIFNQKLMLFLMPHSGCHFARF